MTDPNETANLVNQITSAYREGVTGIEAEQSPVLAVGGNIADQVGRYDELADRELAVRSIATLQARGEYTEEKARILPLGKYQPLTVNEHLEMLALGEQIARYYRHPSQVDAAVRAGASWAQIGAATGVPADAARAAYVDWAEGQHTYAGMDEARYTEALKLAGR